MYVSQVWRIPFWQVPLEAFGLLDVMFTPKGDSIAHFFSLMDAFGVHCRHNGILHITLFLRTRIRVVSSIKSYGLFDSNDKRSPCAQLGLVCRYYTGDPEQRLQGACAIRPPCACACVCKHSLLLWLKACIVYVCA